MNAHSSRSNSDVAPPRGGWRIAALRGCCGPRSVRDAFADPRLRVRADHVCHRARAARGGPRGAAFFYWGVVLMLAACGSSSDEQTQREGENVAVVNGEVILTQDVEAWAREHAVERQVALDALIDEALLVSEARRRGQRPDRSVVRRAAVQEILLEIEEAVLPADVTSDAVRSEYNSTRDRMTETNPNVVMPSFEESEDEIRTMLAGRARFVRLETLLQAPRLNEERVSSLLGLPAID